MIELVVQNYFFNESNTANATMVCNYEMKSTYCVLNHTQLSNGNTAALQCAKKN